jgi:hypothetical protein
VPFPLEKANEALSALREGWLSGAAVIVVEEAERSSSSS